jgi:hypothetical protein
MATKKEAVTKAKPNKRPGLTAEARARQSARAKAQWAAPDSKLRKAYMTAKVRRPPKHAVRLIEEACGQYGANLTTLCQLLGCCPQTLSAWRKRHPEIEEAITRGRKIEEDKLWSVLFKQAMNDNTTAAIVLLKMRFHHRDSGPIPGEKEDSPEDKAAKIRAALRAMDDVDGVNGGNENAPLPSIEPHPNRR